MTIHHLVTTARKLAALLLLSLAFSVASSAQVSHRLVPNFVDAPKFAVEVVQVMDMPVSVREAVLEKTPKGFVLKCLLSNNSADEILRLDYVLLTNNLNNVQFLSDGTQGFKLKGYATKQLTSERHFRIEVSDGYRLFLILNRVFSRESVWEVLKAKKALEAHASGDYSVMPEVVRGPNLYDAPPRSKIIY